MGKPLSELSQHAREELGKSVIGHTEALETLFLTLVCGGHALLEGVPGLGKTLAVRTLARILRVGFRRVQCTPDLMPADIIGANIFNMRIQRIPPAQGTDFHRPAARGRDQPHAAADAGGAARSDGRAPGHDRRHALRLSPLFTVVATQNPVEFEGTYPLPEAELDRFAVKIRVSYPNEADEQTILTAHQGSIAAPIRIASASDVIPPDDLRAARRGSGGAAGRARAHRLHRGDRAARRATGPPSRSAPARAPRFICMQLAKAIAAIEGRDYLLPDDVKRVAPAGAAPPAGRPRRSGPRRRIGRPDHRRHPGGGGGAQVTARPLTPVAISAPAVPRGRVPWTFGPATVRLLLFGFLFLTAGLVRLPRDPVMGLVGRGSSSPPGRPTCAACRRRARSP